MTEAQVDACFRSADLSRDGILQYEEFLEWVFRDPGVVQQYCLKSAKEGLHVVTCENHIEKVFFAAMVILGEDRDLSWTGVKQKLGEFLQKLRQFDPGTLTEAKMRKLKYFTSKELPLDDLDLSYSHSR
eukprot:g25153.t1